MYQERSLSESPLKGRNDNMWYVKIVIIPQMFKLFLLSAMSKPDLFFHQIFNEYKLFFHWIFFSKCTSSSTNTLVRN